MSRTLDATDGAEAPATASLVVMADTADTSPATDAASATDGVAALGYEQARDELVDIVARLENGQAGLEESMRLWERAEALAAHCSQWLDRAEQRLAATDE